MDRVRSTVRLTTKGETLDAVETVHVSEVMRVLGIAESKVNKEGDVPERSGSDAEGSSDEEDPNILRPNKTSHIGFGESTMKPKDLDVMKRFGYIGQKEDDMIKFAGSEIIPEPKDDEVIAFRSFFSAEHRFLMYEMIAEVLKKLKYTYIN